MTQCYRLNIDQSLLNEQSSLISVIIGTLNTGKSFTIDPTDKTAIAALAGMENLLDEIAVQMEAPAYPDRPDIYKMGRDKLSDYYLQETGDSLDDVFGCGSWPLEDGQSLVADYLDSLDENH